MTHSEAFMTAKYGSFHPTFSNDYLLKHGSFFMKPTLHPDGFVYPTLSESARYQVYKDMKCEPPDPDLPLNFAIKQEKPPTPPASTSPKSPSPTDPTAPLPILNGSSKNATWILGKQKLSWDNSTVASYNPDTKMFRCVVCNAVGFLSRIAEHYLGTHTSAKVFQCLHCPYSSTWSRCVRMHMAKHHGVPNAPPSLWKGQPLLEEIFQLLTNLKTTVDSQGRERLDPELCDKKFICPKCPYTTDRRDLYLRHENIHKEDKPYHCYICFKLFNRADHVKKHFLRIHRGHPYDISLVRRRPPRMSSSAGNTSSPTNTTSNGTNGLSNNFSVDKLISNDNDIKMKNEVMDLSQRTSSPVVDSVQTASTKQLKTFQCPYCEWEGVDSWCLRRHMNVHLKNFECPICDFKAGKAERLFTHGYRAHKKLICTKCKFVTDVAFDFDLHVKECCVEIREGSNIEKISEDSLIESDDANIEANLDPPGPSEIPPITPFVLPETAKLFDHRMALDLKGSVSLMPLHNSISYCFPSSQAFGTNGMNSFREKLPDVLVNGDGKAATNGKVESKLELASPVQSSSDSGVTDLTSDNNDQDIVCWHCGCEFANSSSLQIHTELYHREDLKETTSSSKKDQAVVKTKKFSCAICNFNSDKQRTIIEHMRYHTGEVLHCRAGPQCAFKTVCDSTLEKHVETEHNDSLKRCPHCGQICCERIPFIRHYRKCHHSKSCNRCKVIKRSLDPKYANSNESLELLLKANKDQSEEEVKPYLHHNPYSKRSSGIRPYAHCNAAMSKVAVSIPQALQMTVDDLVIAQDNGNRGRKSRKQTFPRKLLNTNMISKQTRVRKRKNVCDKKKRTKRGKAPKLFKYQFRKKLLKRANLFVRRCKLNHAHSLIFKTNINFVRHLFWHHFLKKYCCHKCSSKFRHEYQVLLHRRRYHDNF
ncbi:zinc finger protein 26 [Parasteatoda tepidariorum]|uniref:zinc finger protein 26 n=1 Tax=Parasteatoda tepidariorum TaxID=114398 RepID=UPI001C71D5E1|nr:zinc finger protein 865 [Parasteatoda tepidariorum]XP_042904515.1 zinc finger protein 865 [Parasteatoda tepidariorum]